MQDFAFKPVTRAEINQWMQAADVHNSLNGGSAVKAIEVEVEQDCYLVTVHNPGVLSQDMRIRVRHGMLQIYQHIQNNFVEKGFSTTPISMLPIPPNVDVDAIEAHYEYGELHIVLPFDTQRESRDKNIPIN